MKILFITAPYSFNDASFVDKKNIFSRRGVLPPLGLAYLSSVLEEKKHEIKILDLQISHYSLKAILQIAKEFNPRLIGFSFMTPHKEMILKVINYLKTYLKECFFIAGGPHVTCFSEEFLMENESIDAAVIGEGEYILPELVECLEFNKQLETVKGIYFRKKNKIVKNPPSDKIVELETLPFPARHLLPIKRYIPEFFEYRALPSTSMIATRGCTYAKCTFCYRSGILKRPYRYQSPARTIQEIKLLIKNYQIKEIIFYDDDLFSNFNWINEFCDLLHQERINILWSVRARANAIEYNLMKKAKENGCFALEVGFESGNQHLLDKIKKGITLDQCRRLSEFTHKLGIELIGTFMLAIPGETPEDGQRTIDFAIELGCSYAAFIPTHPFPGTELYEQCQHEGNFLGAVYNEKMQGSRYIPQVCFVPKGYAGKKEVRDIIKRAYLKFYLRKEYIFNHLRSIKSFSDISRYWEGIRFFQGLLMQN